MRKKHLSKTFLGPAGQRSGKTLILEQNNEAQENLLGPFTCLWADLLSKEAKVSLGDMLLLLVLLSSACDAGEV
jgi:hypothetical protein